MSSPAGQTPVSSEQRVVIVGSGAAGLSAALAAARTAPPGSIIEVFEAADRLGGTTALSGGVAWFPANLTARSAGHDDDPGDAMRYLEHIGGDGLDAAMCRAFVDDAARVAALVEAHTSLVWELLDWPDYHPESPGSTIGARSLWPATTTVASIVARRVQVSPELLARHEVASSDVPLTDGQVFRGPIRGRILIAALVEAVDALGVVLHTGRRAVELLTAEDRSGLSVTGVRLADGTRRRGAVVLASGGFQHDADLVAEHLPRPTPVPMGVPTLRGDALRMASSVAADLANLSGGWWMPAHRIVGEEIDGAPHYRPLHHERAEPGSLMVDGGGRRFVNEAQNYGDVGGAMFAPKMAEVWLVQDDADRREPQGALDGAVSAPTLDQLAEAMGVASDSLLATAREFAGVVDRGTDPRYRRGESYYDRWISGGAAMRSLDRPPYRALRVRPGCLGTRGGPRTDDRGRVYRADGTIVRGLFAVGNAAASPFGAATAAGGATIGPALVFGTRAGEVVFDG